MSKKHKQLQLRETSTPAVKKYDDTVRLFAYGTLNIKSIQRKVWKEVKEGRVMKLLDYELDMYPSGIYFITKKIGESVSGKVYELTKEQLEATDWYETNAYIRGQVRMGKDSKLTYVYIQNPEILKEDKIDETSEVDTKED